MWKKININLWIFILYPLRIWLLEIHVIATHVFTYVSTLKKHKMEVKWYFSTEVQQP